MVRIAVWSLLRAIPAIVTWHVVYVAISALLAGLIVVLKLLVVLGVHHLLIIVRIVVWIIRRISMHAAVFVILFTLRTVAGTHHHLLLWRAVTDKVR